MAEIEFEHAHFATSPGGAAVCGVPLVHPFSVSTESTLVECKRCLARLATLDKPERSDCPRCLGLGKVDDRGSLLVGQPYFEAVECAACGGTGSGDLARADGAR